MTTHTAAAGEAPKCRVMSGSARLTIVLSSTVRAIPSTIAAIAQYLWGTGRPSATSATGSSTFFCTGGVYPPH